MKYFFTGLCLISSCVLCGEYSPAEEYETIRDNANDCQQEHELGEFDYPPDILAYRECRDAYQIAVQVPRISPTEVLGVN